jgi:hypothetical protein
MNALLLTIDRLHIGYLGAYGNAWIGTEALDRLAAGGFVFDQCFVDSPDLERLCRSWWLGRHALAPGGEMSDHIARQLAGRGIHTALITDDPTVARHPLAAGFDELVDLDFPDPQAAAGADEETHLAQCFSSLIGWLETADEPFLAWCHLRGLGAAWDAPLARREFYADEDDPTLAEFVRVPSQLLAREFDPDELLGITQAYAGQVALLDACIEAFDETLESLALPGPTLLGLLSARGFPLGEHCRVGDVDQALHMELVHVPLILRVPGEQTAGRSQGLVQPTDLAGTLLDWFGVAPCGASLLPLIRGEAEPPRDRLLIAGREHERAIVTPSWYLRDVVPPELFVRPDDWWQATNVSNRCAETVEGLQRIRAECEQALQSGDTAPLPPLDHVLLHGLE